jgi:hypothetical protein
MPLSFRIGEQEVEAFMINLISGEKPVPVDVTLKAGDTLHIRRLAGGYEHWARIQSIKILSGQIFVWFRRSCDKDTEFLVHAGMYPAFAAEITPRIWAWIADSKNINEVVVTITVNLPPDLKQFVEPSC